MAGNDENVNLLISAAVEGLKNVEGLISDLQELEKTGRVELPDNTAGLREGLDDTSSKMRGLADRLTELREQQGLVSQFAALKKETKALGEEQQAARDRATQLGRALAQTEDPTRKQVQEFERAKKAANGAQQAWQNSSQELNQLRGALDGAGISTKDLAGEQVRINRDIQGVNQEASQLSNELSQMRDSAQQAAAGTGQAAESAEDLGEKADKSSGLLSKLGTGLKTVAAGATALVAGIGASAATLTVFSRGQASLADELTNTANAIGVNREALQVWQIAGERVGLTGDKVTDILRSVTERLGEFAATGGGEAAQVMERLNLQIEDFEGLAPDEQMLKFAQAIESLPKAEQVALLEKLGSDASQLQPLLENNAAGLRAIKAAAEEEGAIYTDEELDKLLKANDIYNDITLKIQGLTRRIGAELAPVVADATDKVMDLFDQNEMGEKLIDLFKRLTDWGADMAAKLVENADSISAGFGTLWDTLQTGASVAVAAFRGLQTIVAGFLAITSAGFSNLMSAAQGLAFALNKVGIVSDEAYSNIKAKAEAARATTADLARKTAEYGRKAIEAGKGVVGAFDDSAESGKKLQEETEKGVGTLTTLAQNVKTTMDSAGDAAEAAMRKQQRATEDARRGLADYGVDIEEVMTGVTTEGRAAVESVGKLAEAIKAAGLDSKQSAEAFEIGFKNALAEINSEEGVKALQRELEKVGDSGAIGAKAVREAMELARVKLNEVSEEAKSVRQVMEQAINTTNSIQDLEFLETSLKAAAMSGKDVTAQLEKVKQRIVEIKNVEGSDGGVAKPVKELKEATDEAGDSADEAKEKYTGAFGNWFSAVLTQARTAVSDLSVATRNLFERSMGGNAIAAESETATEALKRVEQELGGITKRMMEARMASWTVTGSGLTRWAVEVAEKSLLAQQAFWGQAVALDRLKESIDSGAYSMEELNRIQDQTAQRFSLLDDARLDNLQSAIDAAKQKLESLSASADSTLSSLRQRLADIRGDTEEAQRIQYETERKRLQELLEQAQQAGADEAAADYQQSLDTLEQIYKIEQRNRREEQNAREREAADRSREQQLAEIERQRAERELNQPTQRTTQNRTETVKTITVTLGGQDFRVLASDEDALLRALENARSTAL